MKKHKEVLEKLREGYFPSGGNYSALTFAIKLMDWVDEEKIREICNKIADKFNSGGKVFIVGSNFKDLAKSIVAYLTGEKKE